MSTRESPISAPAEKEKHEEHFVENAAPQNETTRKLEEAFGGLEARKKLEKKLLLKIDLRMSVCRLIPRKRNTFLIF
jgi:hypothetical protein